MAIEPLYLVPKLHTHQLHPTEADNNVLLQHLIPAQLMLLAQATPAAHLRPHNLHRVHLYCRRCLGIVKKNGCGCQIRRGRRRSNLLRRCARRGKRDVINHTLAASSLRLVDESDGGGFLPAGARDAATSAVLVANTDNERAARRSRSSWRSSRRRSKFAIIALNPPYFSSLLQMLPSDMVRGCV